MSLNLPVAGLAWSELELGPGDDGSDAGPRPGGVDSESHPKAARGQALGDSTLPLGCNARAPRLGPQSRRTRPRARLGASAPSWALAPGPGLAVRPPLAVAKLNIGPRRTQLAGAARGLRPRLTQGPGSTVSDRGKIKKITRRLTL